MKITKVEAKGVGRYLFARIHTDEGITGIELAEDAAERHPFTPRVVSTRLHEDGSVIDQ